MSVPFTKPAAEQHPDVLEVERLRDENARLRAELARLRDGSSDSSILDKALWNEIEACFGNRPSFFAIAADTPHILQNLWRETTFSYLENPLPAVLKDRLFAYLSRFCSSPYCISQLCALLLRNDYPSSEGAAQSMSEEEIIELLSRPVPTPSELEQHLAVLSEIDGALDQWPGMDSKEDRALFACAVAVFLNNEYRLEALEALQSALGRERASWLLQLLLYIQIAHFWAEAHPEIRIENHIEEVLSEHQRLQDWLRTHRTRVRKELRERLDGDASELQHVRDRVVRLEQVNQELRRSREATKKAHEEAEQHRMQLERELQARKRLERKLRERTERLRLALSAGRMGTWDLDIQTGRAFIDAQEAELLGLEPKDQQIPRQQFFDLIHPDDLSAKIEAFERQEDYEAEFRIIRPDGQVRWLTATTTFVYNEEGEAVRAIGVNFDVTDRKRHEEALKRAKEEAEAANRSKSQFLANMSHEVRTPLTAIIGFTSLLARRLSGNELRYIEKIERSGRRLLDTLDAVLTLARLEANTLSVERKPVHIAEHVQRVIELFRSRAEEKNISLAYVAADEVEGVKAELDPAALKSILEHVLSNAIKFTDEGAVTVRLRRERRLDGQEKTGPNVCIQIEDTGRGIDEAFLPQLFDSFEQESKGLGREFEGSGLGLTITRQLVELMNGRIEVSSEKGTGSTFTIVFPALAGETPSKKTSPSAPAQATLSLHARILAVEDNESTILLLEEVLSGSSELRIATSVQEAIAYARETAFDLVLADINLGTSESGVELLHRLRALPGYADTPIVAVTAHALPGDRSRFLREGFDAYISKPFRVSDLITCVQEQLRQSQSGDL